MWISATIKGQTNHSKEIHEHDYIDEARELPVFTKTSGTKIKSDLLFTYVTKNTTKPTTAWDRLSVAKHTESLSQAN